MICNMPLDYGNVCVLRMSLIAPYARTIYGFTAVGNAFMHSARSTRGTDESVPYERTIVPRRKRAVQNR